jgi:hypothetical protein
MSKLLVLAAILGTASPLTVPRACAQSQPQDKPQNQRDTTKKPKVWTDDNLSSLRSPADVYQDEQQKQKEAQDTAKEPGSAPPASTEPRTQSPKTVQDADAMIAKEQSDLAAAQDYVQQLKSQVNDPTLNDKEKERLQWRLKSRSLTADQLQSDLAELQKEKETLAKKAASGMATPGQNPEAANPQK